MQRFYAIGHAAIITSLVSADFEYKSVAIFTPKTIKRFLLTAKSEFDYSIRSMVWSMAKK